MVFFGGSKRTGKIYLVILLLVSLLLRIIFIGAEGGEGDIGLFRGWSEIVAKVGFSEFYSSVEFCDYPPGYLYILLPVAHLMNTFSDTIDPIVFLKIPAIIFDLLTITVIYFFAVKNLSVKKATIITIFFAINPMAIVNSAIWGQVDSIFTFFLIVCIYALMREKYEFAAMLFAIALVLKPQALLLAPIFIYIFFQKIRLDAPYWIKRLMLCVLAFGVIFYLLILPFGNSLNPFWIVPFYMNTIGGYSYVSLNAYNFWWAIGIGWIEDSAMLGPLSCANWGYLMIVISVIACGILFLRGKHKSKLYYIGALLLASIFMLSCRMHERYLFPAAVLFVFAYIYDGKLPTLLIAIVMSVQNSINLFGAMYWEGSLYGLRMGIAVMGVVVLIAAYVWAIYQVRCRGEGRTLQTMA